jgi:hypothetical protein
VVAAVVALVVIILSVIAAIRGSGGDSLAAALVRDGDVTGQAYATCVAGYVRTHVPSSDIPKIVTYLDQGGAMSGILVEGEIHCRMSPLTP